MASLLFTAFSTFSVFNIIYGQLTVDQYTNYQISKSRIEGSDININDPIFPCTARFQFKYENKVYHYNPRFYGTFSESKAYCESIGAILASISSQDENFYIKTNIAQARYKPNGKDKNIDNFWLGLEPTTQNTMIKWLDGSAIHYSSLRQNDRCNERLCGLQYESDYTYDHPSRFDYYGKWTMSPIELIRPALCSRDLITHKLLTVNCSNDYLFTYKYKEKEYHFDPMIEFTFEGAKHLCNDIGGRIAIPKNNDENAFISMATNGYESWIGGEKLDKTTLRYDWMDGSEIKMDNWDPRRGSIIRYPSCLETCCGMYMIPNPVGRWRDSPCYVRHRLICERQKQANEIASNLQTPTYRTTDNETTTINENSGCRDHMVHPSNGNVYHYNPRFRGNYEDANKYCSRLGGHVSKFDSYEVQMFLLDQQSLSTGTPSVGVWLNGDASNSSERKHSSGITYISTYDPEYFDYENHKNRRCVSHCCGVVRIGYFLDWNINCNEEFSTICSLHITDVSKFDIKQEVLSADPNTACDHLFTNEFHGMEYHVLKENMLNIYDADRYCKSIGGNLVKIINYKQSAFIKWITNNMHIILGGIKLDVESFHYHWIDDKSQLNYSNWMIGKPSCVESCCSIIHEPTGVWSEYSCFFPFSTLCYKKKFIPRERLFKYNYRGQDLHVNEDVSMSYMETKEYCNSIDGSLVSIHSDDQNEFIRRIITIPNAATNRSVWLDARRQDLRNMRDYSWNDGTPINYSRRVPDYDCAGLYMSPDGSWHESDCNAKYHALCKKNDKVLISRFNVDDNTIMISSIHESTISFNETISINSTNFVSEI